MSKIVVDQIEKSGGPTLSLPPVGNVPVEGDFLAVAPDGQLTFAQPDFSPIDDAVAGVQGQIDTALAQVDAAVLALGDINTDDFSNRFGHDKITLNGTFGSELRFYLPPSTDLMQSNGSIGTAEAGCATGTYCGSSGGSTSWTVPAGVTEAQFQIWGAGGNGGGGRNGCCSFGSMGANGEYNYVWMNVTEGDVFTLCGGGACQGGGCNGAYSCHGCNSYVCGSNNTCIMACGGYGYCEVQYGYNYPKANRFGQFFATSSGSVGNYCTMSMGICNDVHGEESIRNNGLSGFGCSTSSYDFIKCAKIPSAVGTIRSCGCMNCAIHHDQAPLPNSTHSFCRNTIGWAYCGGGCLCTNSGCFGLGGWGTVNTGCCCVDYGSHGRVGKVCVNYK